MQSMSMPQASGRRPWLMLMVSLIILVSTVVGRSLYERFLAPPTVTQPPAPVELAAPDYVTRIEQRLRANPDDPQTYAELGLALLQQVRETGDVTLYARAGEAFAAALE